jgi:type III restriction enzyme
LSRAKKSSIKYLLERASVLKKLLVHRAPLTPTGALGFCFDYAKKVSEEPLPGIYSAVRARFGGLARTDLSGHVGQVYQFRNTYVAHQKRELDDAVVARGALREWILTLVELHQAFA